MGMTFDDVKAAGKMRDVMERIATGVVNRMRPDVRIGQVHHYDSGLQYAWVLFPGETAPDGLVKVRIALDQTPTRDIVTYGSDADVVRVLGRPGNYWITDFVSGLPQSPHLKPGSLIRYGGIGIPGGFLACVGGTADVVKYPQLANAIQSKYGTAPAGFVRLPLFHKLYDDVDQITTGLFTAGSGWSMASQNLRVRNSVVYLNVSVSATAAITLTSTNHTNQTIANGTSTFNTLYAPDQNVGGSPYNAVKVTELFASGVLQLVAGVVETGSTLSGNVASGDFVNATFVYPMPDDVAGLNGEVMIIKT